VRHFFQISIIAFHSLPSIHEVTVRREDAFEFTVDRHRILSCAVVRGCYAFAMASRQIFAMNIKKSAKNKGFWVFLKNIRTL